MAPYNAALSVLLQLSPYPDLLLPPNSSTPTPQTHPDLRNPVPTAPTAIELFTALITQARTLISSAAPPNGTPSTWKQQRKPQHFPNVTGSVQLSSQLVRDEKWFCRRSTHRDAAEAGTASWTEFETAFMENHERYEALFTPSVCAAENVAWWDEVKGVALDVGEGGRWEGVSLKLHHMVHQLPRPLSRRSFPIMQGIARRVDGAEGEGEFIVATFPVKADWDMWKPSVVAQYASVERFSRAGGNVEWVMATVSRAGGRLPKWMQEMAVPGVIAKDVDYFLKWMVKERKRLEEEERLHVAQGGDEEFGAVGVEEVDAEAEAGAERH